MESMTILTASLLFAALLAQEPAVNAPRSVLTAADRVPLKTAVPEYPATARRDRIEGEVEVCFEVDRRGQPRRIAVRRSSHRVFEKPAIRAIRASRYEPLEPGEPATPAKTCRTFTFTLKPAGRDGA